MPTLYQIQESYEAFLRDIEEGEIPEEAIRDTLDSLNQEFTEKADNLACAIKNELSIANAIKAEIDQLNERKKRHENTVEKLKNYLMNAMISLNQLKIETPRCKLSVGNNPPRVECEDEKKFIEFALKGHLDLLNIKAPEISKTQIKLALSSGQELPYCKLVSKQALRIK